MQWKEKAKAQNISLDKTLISKVNVSEIKKAEGSFALGAVNCAMASCTNHERDCTSG